MFPFTIKIDLNERIQLKALTKRFYAQLTN